MTGLIALIIFMVVSIIAGTRTWKSRVAAYTVVAVAAFFQVVLVLIAVFRMKPPVGH